VIWSGRKSGLSSVPLLRGGYFISLEDSKLYQQVLTILGEGEFREKRVPKGLGIPG
jgi:hypothetical protein